MQIDEAGRKALAATLFVFAPNGGALVNRVGERALIVAGLTLQAIGFAWSPPSRLPASLAGVSMAMPAAQNAVLGAVGLTESARRPGPSRLRRTLKSRPRSRASRWCSRQRRCSKTRLLILMRRPRSGRLEGWPQTPSLPPCFETPASGGLLSMRHCKSRNAGLSPGVLSSPAP